MLKLLKKFIFRKNTNKPVLLGRWNYSKQNLKNIYANYDHCGDTICKDPTFIKNNIKTNETIKK